MLFSWEYCGYNGTYNNTVTVYVHAGDEKSALEKAKSLTEREHWNLISVAELKK